MLTNVSKFKATFNGQAVSAKRTTMKSYRGGQFYIRAYVNDEGRVMYSIYRIAGKVYGGYSRRNSPPMRIKHRGTRIKVLPEQRIFFKDYEYHASDFGLTADYAVLFDFDNRTKAVLDHLVATQDRIAAWKFLYGYNDGQIANAEYDVAYEKEYCAAMDREDYDSVCDLLESRLADTMEHVEEV